MRVSEERILERNEAYYTVLFELLFPLLHDCGSRQLSFLPIVDNTAVRLLSIKIFFTGNIDGPRTTFRRPFAYRYYARTVVRIDLNSWRCHLFILTENVPEMNYDLQVMNTIKF